MPSPADMFIPPENWPTIEVEEDKPIQTSSAQLEKKLRAAPDEVLTRTGPIPEALARLVWEKSIDFLVLGTHGRRGVRKLLLGSVAETILRHAACPVLNVGPSLSCPLHDEIRFQHILFATDFSKDSLSGLAYAVSWAEEDQARLTLLHVVDQPSAGIANLKEFTASTRRRLKELVSPDAEPWCNAECVVEFGELYAPPADRILQIARDREADLIVLGVRPIRGSRGVITHLASTTAQIITHASCPVLTVRGAVAA
jgi:nucleotide-binding universal stress UspA family protein